MKRKLTMFLTLYLVGLMALVAQTQIQVAQTQIQGTVVDDTGEPVIGATIRINGESLGTTTDINGKFILSAPAGSTLIVSYVGMITQEVKVAPNLRIVLKQDSELLQEVVVTGMTVTDKRLFTGATDKLSAEDVKLDGLADVSRALEGRSAGVSVQNVSGTFGTAPKNQGTWSHINLWKF